METRDVIIVALIGFGAWWFFVRSKSPQQPGSYPGDGSMTGIAGGTGMNNGVASTVNPGPSIVSAIAPGATPPSFPGLSIARPTISPTVAQGLRLAAADATPPPPPALNFSFTQGLTTTGVSQPIGSGAGAMGPLPVRPADTQPSLVMGGSVVRQSTVTTAPLAPTVNPMPFIRL